MMTFVEMRGVRNKRGVSEEIGSFKCKAGLIAAETVRRGIGIREAPSRARNPPSYAFFFVRVSRKLFTCALAGKTPA